MIYQQKAINNQKGSDYINYMPDCSDVFNGNSLYLLLF